MSSSKSVEVRPDNGLDGLQFLSSCYIQALLSVFFCLPDFFNILGEFVFPRSIVETTLKLRPLKLKALLLIEKGNYDSIIHGILGSQLFECSYARNRELNLVEVLVFYLR